MDEPERMWRVGELAAATGLTVRALHYYDQLGLVEPSRRTAGGHRDHAPAPRRSREPTRRDDDAARPARVRRRPG
ncbi:MAG: MerR family DNA-binding transcriptional regulator [Jatrophihabitans sp.]